MIGLFPKGEQKKRKTAIGLDVDDKSVKVVEIRHSVGGSAVTKYAIADVVPFSPAEDKATSISNTIKKVFAEHSIDAGEVFSAVSGPGVSIRRITVPQMPEEELYGAVKWEAKNLIPFPMDAVTLDYYIIGKVTEKGTEKLDVIVVAAQDEVINHQIKIIEGAGLKVAGVTATPFAIWDVLKRNISPKEGEVIALIDIGAEAASINLFKGNILQFTREISVAGESVTKAMTGVLISDQWQLSLTYEQAEKIKVSYGIPREDSQDKTPEGIPLTQILEVMKPTLRRMLNEILRSFDYYKEQFREPKISKVFLAGGSSKIKNLEEYLSTGLGTKVEVVNPLQGIAVSLGEEGSAKELAEVSPRLTLALGLALGEARSLNLVRAKKPAKKGVELGELFGAVKIPNASLIAAIVVVLIFLMGYNFYLGRKAAHYRAELESKKAILTDLKLLAERRDIINRVQMEETHVRETLEQFNGTIISGITLTQITYNNSGRTLKVAGLAQSPRTVGRFMTTLEESPYFSKVNLIESRAAGEGGTMDFNVSCHVD